MSNDTPDKRLAELKRLIDSCGDLLDQPSSSTFTESASSLLPQTSATADAPTQSMLRDMSTLVSSLTRMVSELAPLAAQKSSAGLSADVDEEIRKAEQELAKVSGLPVHENADAADLARAIRDHVAVLRRQHRDKNEEAEHRIRLLTAKLNNMEKEASSMRACMQRERDQAYTDQLTSLPNRIAYDERIGQEYARWSRYGSPLTMVIWDIDHFKKINDERGHAAGDAVLRQLAQIFKNQLRRTDFTSRWGGEEFVTLMPETPLYVAFIVAEKLRMAVQQYTFQHAGETIPVTLSAGVAQFHEGDTAESVFNRADDALYRAKEGGRNQSRLEELVPDKGDHERSDPELRLVTS